MINHTRSLLLNIDGGTDIVPAYPGEEFIPPEYLKRVLPTYLELPYSILYGTSPDRDFLNFRVRQLTTLLHSTELEQYVLDPDPRVTYWPIQDDIYFDKVFGVEVNQILGETPVELFTVGAHPADEGAGQLRTDWELTVIDEATVGVIRRTSPRLQTVEPYIIDSNLSSLVPLPGSPLKVRFRTAAPLTSWVVTALSRPSTDLGVIFEQLRVSTGETQERIFSEPGEPVTTFRNLFLSHPQMAYKFGGYLLAFVRDIEKQLPEAL